MLVSISFCTVLSFTLTWSCFLFHCISTLHLRTDYIWPPHTRMHKNVSRCLFVGVFSGRSLHWSVSITGMWIKLRIQSRFFLHFTLFSVHCLIGSLHFNQFKVYDGISLLSIKLRANPASLFLRQLVRVFNFHMWSMLHALGKMAWFNLLAICLADLFF